VFDVGDELWSSLTVLHPHGQLGDYEVGTSHGATPACTSLHRRQLKPTRLRR